MGGITASIVKRSLALDRECKMHCCNSMGRFLPFLRPNVTAAIRLSPVAVATTLLLSLGGPLQYSLFSLAEGDSLTVYEAVYGKGLAQIPTWDEWLFSRPVLAIFLMAIIATTYSFRRKSSKSVFLTFGISCAAGMTAIDFGFTMFDSTQSWDNMPNNIVANLIGSMLLSGVIITIIFLSHEISIKTFESSRQWRTKLISTVIAATIFASVIFSYTFFFQPLPVYIELQLSPQSRGFISPKTINSEQDDALEVLEKPSPFSGFFVQNVSSPTYAAEGRNILWNWKAEAEDQPFDVEIMYYSGCYRLPLNKLPVGKPALTFHDVKTLSTGFLDAVTKMELSSDEPLNSDVDFDFGTLFWIEKSQKADSTDITHFVPEDGSVTIRGEGDVSMLMTTGLVSATGKVARRATKTLALKVNGERHNQVFVPNTNSVAPSARSCLLVSPNSVNAISVTMVVRIKKRIDPEATLLDRRHISVLTVKNGAFRQLGVPTSEADHGGVVVGLITATSSRLELSMKGQKINLKPDEEITAMGNFKGTLRDGSPHFDGVAHLLWKGQARLNPTKWEYLSEGWAIALFGGLITALLALLRGAIALFRRNRGTNVASLV